MVLRQSKAVKGCTQLEREPERGCRREGFTLIEVSLALSLIAMILVGVMAALSSAFLAQRNNSEIVETQFLTQQVIEEAQDSAFDDLLSFNGTSVTSTDGLYRAQITASSAGLHLVRIEVVSSSIARPTIWSRAVTLISDPD